MLNRLIATGLLLFGLSLAAAHAEDKPKPAPVKAAATSFGAPRVPGERPLASPAVRLKAKEAGIDLRQVAGSGPAGRITHEDI